MADRESAFVISFDGKAGNLNSVLDALKRRIRNDVSEIQSATEKVELFKNTRARADEAFASFTKLSAAAADFRRRIDEIESKGGKAGKELTDALKATEKQITSTSREFNRQAAALDKLDASLKIAGVDTKKLADEEVRLAASLKAAEKAQAEVNARMLLGVKSSKEAAAEVQKLQAAYNLLRNSGASVQELTQAQRALADRTRELQDSQGTLANRLSGMRTAAVAGAAAIAGVALAAREAVAAFREYEESLARIGTVSTLTESELQGLGQGVRDLAQTLGFDVQEGLKAVYDLLRAGVPAGNVLEVLATADDAAKAGITDLGTAAKLSGTLIRGFGIEAKNLKPALDALFVAAQNGGATFEELAAGLGDLAPVARATGTPIEEVAAALQVMTRAGLEGPAAISQLTQVLTRLSSADTVAKLRELGIETGNFATTIQQIAERGLGLGELLELGVTSKRAASGVAALTQDSTALANALTLVGNSSGAVDRAAESLNKLQAESIQRLVTSLQNLRTTLGSIITPTNQTINSLSSLVQLADVLAQRLARVQASANGSGLTTIAQAASSAVNPMNLLGNALVAAGAAAEAAKARLAETGTQVQETAAAIGAAERELVEATAAAAEPTRVRLAALRAELAAIVPELEKATKAILASTSESVAAINQRTATQIAALDTLSASEAANAAQRVAIEKKANDERLAVIQRGSAAAIAIFNVEADARIAATGKTKEEIAKVERAIAEQKKTTLGEIVKQYEAHVAQLVALETGHLNKIREIQDKRADLNLKLEDKIREIRGQSLTEYEKYAQTIREIDKAISKAREELAAGNLKQAEQFANRAIELSSGIATKIEQGGRVVVTQLQAQETAVGKIRAAQEVLNGVLSEQEEAAKDGAKATAEGLELAQRELAKFKSELDKVNEIVQKGIEVKVTTDAAQSVAAARAEIQKLDGIVTRSEHIITVTTVEANASGGFVGDKLAAVRRLPINRGAVQRFATGGFARPAWSKVPGSGNRDSVRAGLQAGSFVVRKSASRYYGDTMMRALALRGPARFALGGPVNLPLLVGKIGDLVARTRAAGLGGGGEGGGTLDLVDKLTRIVEAMRGIKPSSTGLDVGRWAGALLNRLPFMAEEKVEGLRELLDRIFESLLEGAKTAREFGSSFVVDQGLLGYLFARGGGVPNAGTDTVPALLTPGEWVVKAPAVARVERIAPGLLHAINTMRLPREALAGMLSGPAAPRIQRFADGGPVASATPLPFTRGTGEVAAPITVNVTAAAGSLLSEDNVRRFIVPVLRDIQKRSR